MPTSREKLTACAIGQSIYAIGGAIGENQPGLAINERYDVATDTWSIREPMPTGRRSASASVVDGKCYVIGGRHNFGGTVFSIVEAYDPTIDRWATKTSMPTARFAHASATIDGIVYAVGGTSNGVTILDTLQAYDTATDSWTTLAPMPTPRGALTASAVNGKLYAIGGTMSPGTQQYSTVEVYDPTTNTWAAAASMQTARLGLASSVANGRIYTIGGGVGRRAFTIVESYDPLTDAWTTVTPINVARVRLASAAVGGSVFAIGGAESVTPPHPGVNIVEAYVAPDKPFSINAGLNDAWFNPLTDGQGFFITVFPDIGFVSLAWFTYDTELPDAGDSANLGDPGHRWLTALGSIDGNKSVMDISVASGGIFDTSTVIDRIGDGTIILTFSDCNSGTVEYDIPSIGQIGTVPIQRVATDNIALCEALIAN